MARGGVPGRGGTDRLMIWRTFGLPLSRRPLNSADGVVLLALVGLLAL
jgi:hypothetical protein